MTTKPRRKRPGPAPKPVEEKYCTISIRLHPATMAWAKKEAKRRGIGYQTIINETLLKEAVA